MTIDSTGRSLVGRETELRQIGEFLDRAAIEGGALQLNGEPGIGKTALLQVAADRAAMAGTRVVRAEGVEFEATTVCSGLNQALLPLAGGLELLTRTHRDVLAVVLGLAGGEPADQVQVALAALSLVRTTGAERPLLLIIDDLQWVDRYSADVLSFVVRRLAGSRVGFLAATRASVPDAFEQARLPRLDLPTLSDDAASALLRARFPALAPRVRQRLLDEAHGNPLALLELPPALTSWQRASWQSLPPLLPLSDRLQALFAARVTGLPAATRDLLLLAVLYGAGDLAILNDATDGNLLADLAPAERTGLVHVDDWSRQLVFRHPLTRSAVVGLSTAQERRQAHRRLADALVELPDRRAWHLAEAAVAPDEEVAALLELSAHRIVSRGDPLNAAAALARAADLSPDPAARGRRLAEAAYIGGIMSWQMAGVPSMLAKARQTPLGAAAELHAAAADSFFMLNGDYDVDAAHRLVVAAIEAFGGDFDANDKPLIAALDSLFQVCLYSGRAEMWEPYLSALRRLTPAIPRGHFVLAYAFADPVRASPAVLAELDAAVVSVHSAIDPEELGKITSAAVYVDRLPACREPLRRLVRGETAGGAVTQALGARMQLIVDSFCSGRWHEAEQLRREGVESCEANGNLVFVQSFNYLGGLLAAGTGEHDQAQGLAAELVGWGAPRGARLMEVWASHIRTLDAIGRGDFEDAYQNVSAISPPGTFPAYTATAVWVCLDLVEAAIRTGRTDEASAHVRAMREAGLPAISSRLDFITRSCTALVSESGSAAAAFENALSVPETRRWPFDVARVQLLHGEHLRRAHANVAARLSLVSAGATFERLGARPWIARAEAELRSAGGSVRSIGAGLTMQEYEIAALAAAGLTNKQIGERLFLSHRTISTHLYRVFPKLGITKRAALRDALTAATPQNN